MKSMTVLPNARALAKLPRIGLPVLSYAGLGATTFGTIKLLTGMGMTASSASALVGMPVAVPALVLLGSVAIDGGAGMARRMGGKPATQRVISLAETAALAVGVPPPKHVYTIPSAEANAFAAGGVMGNDCVVAVTEGLLSKLTKEETLAVLAHEMGHLRHRDVGRNVHVAVAATGLGGIYEAGKYLLRSDDSKSKKQKDESSSAAAAGLTLMGIGLGTQAVAHLLRLSASRAAELNADAAAAEAFGAAAMISALQKIETSTADTKLRSGMAGSAMAHAMISDGKVSVKQGQGFFGNILGLMRTHPSIDERVAALRAIETR